MCSPNIYQGGPMATATRQSKASEESINPIVARRLAFLADAKRRAAAKRFAEGESVAKLAQELGISSTHAAYSLRQQLVEDGSVSRIKPDDIEAIRAALADEDD